MIYVTGDTHGEQSRILAIIARAKPGDIVIICGDFGFIFRGDSSERVFLDKLSREGVIICFVDGNHENFDAINRFPLEEWNGGKVHRIRNNIYHLMRGQVFYLEGKKFLTFGGAYSIDKYVRTEHFSWWKEEIPSGDEYKECSFNLEKHNFEIDFVITHTAPREIIRRMGYTPDGHDAELTGFLEWIMYESKYKQWFFGHWHKDEFIDDKHRALWFDVIEI